MKLNTIFFFVYLSTISSCSVDYDVSNTKPTESELIIINSILNPHQPIQIQLHKLIISEGKYSYKGLQNANITLIEGQTAIFNSTCPDSILLLNHYPKINTKYSIEVSYTGSKTAKARTIVPPSINCNTSFSYNTIYQNQSTYIIKLTSFQIPSIHQIALWITAYRIFENYDEIQYNELYANNVLVDKRNSTAGMEAINSTVGSIYYNGFLRVKNKNLSSFDEILFTPNFVYNEYIDDSNGEQVGMKVKLITASPEYDQFQKTLYDQKSIILTDNDLSSVFYQPKQVYTNIENGLGIFAAINEVSHFITLPIDIN